MDPADGDRRRSMLIHLALLASIGGYGALLAVSWRRMSMRQGPAAADGTWFLLLILMAVGVLGAGSFIARRRLQSGPGRPLDRVRAYFIVRGALAETVAIYGLLLGFLGAPLRQVVAMFATALAANAFFAPTREAWADALRLAESKGP